MRYDAWGGNIYTYHFEAIAEGASFDPTNASDSQKCAMLEHEMSTGMKHAEEDWSTWKASFAKDDTMVDDQFALFLHCLTL